MNTYNISDREERELNRLTINDLIRMMQGKLIIIKSK